MLFRSTLFTGGGALGAAIRAPNGQWRTEIEGRARGPMSGVSTGTLGGSSNPVQITATGGWSTLVNFWRDVDFNDRVGAYMGGGFGVGGYSLSATSDTGSIIRGSNATATSALTTFAWQIGTGVTYQWSQRVVFDLGYRFYAMTPGTYNASVGTPYGTFQLGQYTSAFSASELLFSVRIYEPFRGIIR